MRRYADASLLVSAFTQEAASEAAEGWFAALMPGELVVSDWCEAEAISALAGKARRGEIDVAGRDVVIDGMRVMLASAAENWPVERQDFRRAADLLLGSDAPLRAGDALHLAIADRAGATLWTLDKRMAEGGQGLGLDARLLA